MLIVHFGYRFPKNKSRRTLWLNCLGLTEIDECDLVCDGHFSSNDLREEDKQKLKKTAFPVLHSPQLLNHEKKLENDMAISNEELRRSVRKKKRTKKIEQSTTWVNI